MLSFTALVVCGNGNGTVGFGTGKSAEMGLAVDKVGDAIAVDKISDAFR